jgi:integral membrane protein
MQFLITSLGRLRGIAIIEAISYLALMGFAMPMKYYFGDPSYIPVIGMAHGVLFVLFCAALLQTLIDGSVNLLWCVIIFIASLIPIVPFFLDKKIAAMTKPSTT